MKERFEIPHTDSEDGVIEAMRKANERAVTLQQEAAEASVLHRLLFTVMC